MTLEEIEEALSKAAPRPDYSEYYDADEAGWHSWEDDCGTYGDFKNGYSAEIPTLGVVERVDANEGGGGGGDNIWLVFKVTSAFSTRYFKKTGYYASYEGSSWDGPFTEVHPVDRVVRFYE